MPLGELEIHPYLNKGKIKGATKLILGSFPVYECTDPDNQIKKDNRLKEGTIRFFYGSNRNSLWTKYSKYIDNSLSEPKDELTIIKSLKKHNIAISDIIASCERKDFSSEDSDLLKKNWNTDMIRGLIKEGVTKILCTSKGVLGDLEKKIICSKKNPLGFSNEKINMNFQSNFIRDLNGDTTKISNPISRVFNIEDKELIALAIPSPGSPQRQIHNFGNSSSNGMDYAERYFKKSFEWLNL